MDKFQEELFKDFAKKSNEVWGKETPMKPVNISHNFWYKTGRCPKCIESTWEKAKFCESCGQRLDWSKDNEL